LKFYYSDKRVTVQKEATTTYSSWVPGKGTEVETGALEKKKKIIAIVMWGLGSKRLTIQKRGGERAKGVAGRTQIYRK